MAKVMVYSRLEQAVEFRFGKYVQASKKDAKEVPAIGDEDRIILNGCNQVFNNGRVAVPYAVTEFSDEYDHDIKNRKYPLTDLDRLKEHTTFKSLLKDGKVSLGVPDDLSNDLDGSGKLTDKELEERDSKKDDADRVRLAE